MAIETAKTGDAVANEIVRDAANDLALAVESVARRLRIASDPFPLVLAGGGLRANLLAHRLQARLRRTLPHAAIVFPAVEPAIGAALLAIRTKNADPSIT